MAVLAVVHQELLVVEEVPWAPVSLVTCFFLLQRQEEVDLLEVVLLASLHQEAAFPNPVVQVVPGPEEVVSAGWDHCTLECHLCLRLVHLELGKVHPAGSCPMAPRTSRWSTA